MQGWISHLVCVFVGVCPLVQGNLPKYWGYFSNEASIDIIKNIKQKRIDITSFTALTEPHDLSGFSYGNPWARLLWRKPLPEHPIVFGVEERRKKLGPRVNVCSWLLSWGAAIFSMLVSQVVMSPSRRHRTRQCFLSDSFAHKQSASFFILAAAPHRGYLASARHPKLSHRS